MKLAILVPYTTDNGKEVLRPVFESEVNEMFDAVFKGSAKNLNSSKKYKFSQIESVIRRNLKREIDKLKEKTVTLP
jgi:hypothetical protein